MENEEIKRFRQQFLNYDENGDVQFGLPWFTEKGDIERLEQFLSDALQRTREETIKEIKIELIKHLDYDKNSDLDPSPQAHITEESLKEVFIKLKSHE